jgi:hypothetical protein
LGIAGTTAVAGKELCFAEEHRTKRERERERERERWTKQESLNP